MGYDSLYSSSDAVSRAGCCGSRKTSSSSKYSYCRLALMLLVLVITAACLAFGLLPRLLEVLMQVTEYEKLTCQGTMANQLHLSELVEAGHSWARSSVTVVEGFIEFDDASSFPFFLRASPNSHSSTVIAVQCDHCQSTEKLIPGMYVRARGTVSTSGQTVVLRVGAHDDGHDLIDCSRETYDALKATSLKTKSSSGRKLLTKEMLHGWRNRITCSSISFTYHLLGASFTTTDCSTPPPSPRQPQGQGSRRFEGSGMAPLNASMMPDAGPESFQVESGAATSNTSTVRLTQEEFDVELRLLLEHQGSQCPSNVSTPVKTGRFQKKMPIPDIATELYPEVYADSPRDDDGVLYTPMNHDLIQPGDKYCARPEPSNSDVVMGGVIMFKKGDECHFPPLDAKGKPCCQLYAWQPNAEGYYYDNCSMKMDIRRDGLWYFISEVPGNETSAGWGADSFPHIHYDVLCRDCEPGPVFQEDWYRFKNKFYAGEVCDLPGCGDKKWPMPGPEHKADEAIIDGMKLFHYNIIVPDKPSD